MNILVVNVHSTDNAGDAALLDVTLDLLYDNFPGSAITLAMNDPKSYCGAERMVGSFTHWFKTSSRSMSPWRTRGLFLAPLLMAGSLLAAVTERWFGRPVTIFLLPIYRSLIESYAEADLVVSCAGNFFYSSGRIGLPFLLACLAPAYGWLMGKPLYTMPQTIGPLDGLRDRIVMRWLLSKMRILHLRDRTSVEALEAAHIHHSNLHIVPDIAFLHQEAERNVDLAARFEDGFEKGASTDGPLLGVTLINWGAQNRRFHRQAQYEEAVASAIRTFLLKFHGRVLLFGQVRGPLEADDDLIPARRVAGQLTDLCQYVSVVEGDYSPAQLQAMYAQVDLFLGSRLHSCIFAMTSFVPVLAIAYQYKTRGILRMLGLEEWVIEIENVSSTLLFDKLERLYDQRSVVRTHLQQEVPIVQAQIAQVGERIYQDFQKR